MWTAREINIDYLNTDETSTRFARKNKSTTRVRLLQQATNDLPSPLPP